YFFTIFAFLNVLDDFQQLLKKVFTKIFSSTLRIFSTNMTKMSSVQKPTSRPRSDLGPVSNERARESTYWGWLLSRKSPWFRSEQALKKVHT
ncbi:MAG: hypothetical protein AAFR17_20855, partial [Pseudomonadota bacterium]